MATQDLKAKLLIEAETRGDGNIEALASELEALAREGGEAAPKLDALAQSLREMDERNNAVTAFTNLRRQVADTAEAMNAASANVDRLAGELEQSGQAAQRAAAAQEVASRNLRTARQHQADLASAVAQTRTELRQMREAYQQGGSQSQTYAEQIANGAAQLKVLQAEQRGAAEQVRALASVNREAAAESRATAKAQQAAANEYERAVKSAGQVSSALGQQNQALTQARQRLDDAGLSTRRLSDQQAELRAALVQAERQASEYVDAVARMRSETASLGPALQATFQRLGMRGVQQITAEIEQLQAAMRGLKGQRLLPEDAARASAELQRRIEGLRAEVKGAQGDAHGAAQAVQSLGSASGSASYSAGSQLATHQRPAMRR